MAPSGTAMPTEKIIVITNSTKVGSTRWAIINVTGRLVKTDVPRSPRAALPNHSTKRTTKGLSRPSDALMRSISCGVA